MCECVVKTGCKCCKKCPVCRKNLNRANQQPKTRAASCRLPQSPRCCTLRRTVDWLLYFWLSIFWEEGSSCRQDTSALILLRSSPCLPSEPPFQGTGTGLDVCRCSSNPHSCLDTQRTKFLISLRNLPCSPWGTPFQETGTCLAGPCCSSTLLCSCLGIGPRLQSCVRALQPVHRSQVRGLQHAAFHTQKGGDASLHLMCTSPLHLLCQAWKAAHGMLVHEDADVRTAGFTPQTQLPTTVPAAHFAA